MATTEGRLRRGIERRDDGFVLTLDPAFQGLPDTAHGGSVLAVFHALAGSRLPCSVRGMYRKPVPLGLPLQIMTTRRHGTLTYQLFAESRTMLADGSVRPCDRGGGGGALRDPLSLSMVVEEGAATPASSPEADSFPLPVSRSCFACGTDNPLGLHVALRYDEVTVGGIWQPRPTLAVDGNLAPVALTTLLDEAAFWLGALASGESGMTTDLDITLHRPVPFGTAIAVAGPRGQVRQRHDDPRYWQTEVAARDTAGRTVAEARITFVAVRGAARRLITGMLAMNPPEVLNRVFPTYAR